MSRFVIPSSGSVLLALALCTSAQADVFTVGPDGAFATLALAVANAEATAGASHEIRLQAVIFTDKPFIDYEGDKSLSISGGWNAAFDAQHTDPEATAFTVLPGDDARPLTLRAASGAIEFSNATVFGGQRVADSGGLSLRTSGTGLLTVRDCVVRDNAGSTENSIAGGGIDIFANGASRVRVSDCDVRDNSLEAGASAAGGGIYATADNEAGIVLEHNRIVANRLRMLPGSSTPFIELNAAGVWLYAFSASSVQLLHNRIVANIVEAADATVVNAQGVGLSATTGGAGGGIDASITIRGNIVRGNVSEAVLGTRAHVLLATGNSDRLDLGDTEITQGIGTAYGLFAGSYGNTPASTLDITNVTIADNDGMGMRGNDRFPVVELGSLFNTIVTGHGTASLPPEWMARGSNLIDVPVAFAAPAAGNYAPAAGSVAIDAGDGAPPGGLGATDAGGGTRIVGAEVDIGAHEFGSLALFGDGFE
ncbi:right-handed parallel beta-helix repeat-containing protein [Chiayiivirga flava]|uniref:Right handed beta helix domain-containing protein n=1 Tax=Chiayiivirga flava TaxID=659595 RepID=A0A7W8G203_9GAMM|nr:right-handed parallel beta-helix repeat-containing protein [Chiayiivirga flava]MBB5209438.1 hypothetical protein [Chiayiivirga flava]